MPKSKQISPDCVIHFDLEELTHEQLCQRWRQPCLHVRQILDHGLHGCRNPFMESCTHRCCIKTWMTSESRRADAKKMHTAVAWTDLSWLECKLVRVHLAQEGMAATVPSPAMSSISKCACTVATICDSVHTSVIAHAENRYTEDGQTENIFATV